MPTLQPTRIAELLTPYLAGKPPLSHDPPANLYHQLAAYLDLLLKWNARTNLTAIRNPEEIVRRHFGESLFAARHLPDSGTLLDLGSGAGFPGLPTQILHPNLSVTLAESQNKKATFLREVIRTLDLPTQVWAARAESLPDQTTFDTVALRAVDRMEQAVVIASRLARDRLAILTTRGHMPPQLEQVAQALTADVPGSQDGVLLILNRTHPAPH